MSKMMYCLPLFDIPVFPNIAPYKNSHVHGGELIFPETLLSLAAMINICLWCYTC